MNYYRLIILNLKELVIKMKRISWGIITANIIALLSLSVTIYFQYFYEKQELSVMLTKLDFRKVVGQQPGVMIYTTFLVFNNGNQQCSIIDYNLNLNDYPDNNGNLFISNKNDRTSNSYLIKPGEQYFFIDSLFVSCRDIKSAYERLELHKSSTENDKAINRPLYLELSAKAIDYRVRLVGTIYNAANIYFYQYNDGTYDCSGGRTLERSLFDKLGPVNILQ